MVFNADAPLADFMATDFDELLLLLAATVLVSVFLLLAKAIASTTRAMKNLKLFMVILNVLKLLC